jgi:hypothetical protein
MALSGTLWKTCGGLRGAELEYVIKDIITHSASWKIAFRHGRTVLEKRPRSFGRPRSSSRNDWLRHMAKLLTFSSIFRLNLFLMAAASVAQAGTKQGEWTSPLGGKSAYGLADDGISNIVFQCDPSKHSIIFDFDPRGYRGHALRKVLDLEQPFILEVRPVSGENQKFPIVAFLFDDGARVTYVLRRDPRPRADGQCGDGIS